MARSVVALDTTVFYTSIARLISGDPKPYVGFRHAPEISKKMKIRHYPAMEMNRHAELAEEVVEAVTTSPHGVPELVVLVKPNIGALAKDPSGHRRLGVHWELVRQFHAANVPVGEVSLLSVQKACLGRAQWGKRGTDPLTEWVSENWVDFELPLREDDNGNFVPDERYRTTTVALAAVAALAAGFPVPQLPVSDDVLAILRSGSQMPPSARLPEVSEKWVKSSKRLAPDEYVEERLKLIASEPLEELKTWHTPKNRELRRALEARLGTNEDAALEAQMMGGGDV